jgi:DNA repair protein RadC
MAKKTDTAVLSKPENLNKNHRSRMRKRYLECGFAAFQEHEILEMLLFYALPRVNTNPIAHQLLNTFHSLAGVMDADVSELKKIPGIQDNAAIFLKMLPEVFRCYQISHEKEVANRFRVDEEHMAEMKQHLRNLYTGVVREKVVLISLDNDDRIIDQTFVSEGSAGVAGVSVRAIAEIAMKNNAARVIVAHNHPDAPSMPSNDDMFFTKNLYAALHHLNIELDDHFIVGQNDVLSFRYYGFWDMIS